MGRVALLPSALANQIAAGEVVERPASVVKELVENAIDAGATTIFIDIEEGGRRLIRVVDDGSGMDRGDAVRAVERHATSKIHTSDDLAAISTLGFRGEALPSIASVSRFTMVTRAADDLAATEVRIDAGGEPQVRDAGGAVGTRIEVADLFHAVPARLKFLKRVGTEMSHIGGFVMATALGYPHIHLRLTHNGRVSADHPAAPSLKQRIFQVLGADITRNLYEARLDGPVRVMGFISNPTCQRPNARGIYTFVNGRLVRDKVIQHAIISAYGNLIERGRHPHAVLYIWVDPGDVDVNVHPAKAEVRFVRSGQVHEAIVGACRATLAASPWTGPEQNPLYEPQPMAASTRLEEPRLSPLPLDAFGLAHRPMGGERRSWPARGNPVGAERRQELDFSGEGKSEGFFSRMRVIGQARRTYLLCEGADGLYVIDQHAAHERVGYERIKSGYCDARLARQQLLFPLQLELGPEEGAAVVEHAEELTRLGFSLEPFGGPTWQVTAIPALLVNADIERLVRDLVAELAEVGKTSLGEAQLDLLFATMACHTVVRAGDRLGTEEIRALLEAMDAVDLGANCPHGRPVMVSVPFVDLERKLHRR